MKAFRLTAWQRAPELVDVDVPEPRRDEVLVRVGGAGACHSDLHLMEWPAGKMPYDVPFTLGHETAGWVEALGPEAEGLAPGDPVAVHGPWGCGRCRACMTGRDNCCERWRSQRGRGAGLGRDGGMAEMMLVPNARFLIPLGSLDPVQAAPLTDAGLTPYHAIRGALDVLVPGSTTVVIGVGGLGNLAVQILAALTATRIIAVDISADRLALARAAGAEHTVVAGADTVAAVRDANDGRGAELVLDFVGSDASLATAASLSRALGRLVLVGAGAGTAPFGFFAVPQECQLSVSSWGTRTELGEVIELAAAGRVTPHVTTFPLHRAADAYAALRDGTLQGRAVVVPGTA